RKIAIRGVEIVKGARVSTFRDGVVELTNGEKIPTSTLIWTAGTAPNPLVAALPLPKRNGRIVVNEYLGVSMDGQGYGRLATVRLFPTLARAVFIRRRASCSESSLHTLQSKLALSV